MAIPARRQELSDIRRAASGATRDIRRFETALRQLRKRGVRIIQQGAQTVRKTAANRYQRMGLYADRRGVLRKIRKPGAKWQARKKRLGLDLRPGIARKGVLKTLQSPRIIVRTDKGFYYDLRIPDITVTGRATVGKTLRNLAGKRLIGGKGKDRKVVGTGVKRQVTNRRSFRVNSYIDQFADSQAPGLGNIAKADLKQLEINALREVNEHMLSLAKAGRFRLDDAKFLKISVKSHKVLESLRVTRLESMR